MKRHPLRTWLPYAFAAIVAPLIAAWPQRAQAQFHWDPLIDGNGIVGGPGSWNLTNTFWDPTGTDLVAGDNVAWPNLPTSQAIFGGSAGTVLMNQGAALTANSLTFNTGGYVIAPNAAADVLALAGTTPTVTVSNAGQSAIINSIISSAGGLVAAGNGFLTLGGANGAGLAGQVIVSPGTTLGLANNTALGALGAGNETIVQSGGTLRVGGSQMGNLAPAATQEIISIAGAGVGGAGALVNTRSGGNNTLGKVVLTADATLSAGGNNPISHNAAGTIVTSAGGRTDIRQNAAPTAGQAHLDLGGFTLTKTGGELLALVNSEVTSGNIIVNEGVFNIEAGSLLQGTGTVTVNAGGALGFWSVSAAGNVTRPIVLNGGSLGDPTSTGAAQTINSPVSVTGALRPNFTAVSGNQTTLAGVISESSFTGGGFDKRGGGTLAFSNTANTFSAPLIIRAGILRGIYNTAFPAGGVSPAVPITTTDTPLGTNPNITLAGGTLSLQANMANNNSQQVWSNPLNITVDQAPGGMAFDRVAANTAQVDKMVRINSLTIAPASAANGWSIGQNQFTFTQGNTHRLEIPSLTMNNDTLLNLGDFHISGTIASAGQNSIVHGGGNTIQFLSSGTMEHNALFNVSGTLRVGSGFGTPIVSNIATAGSGPIYISPGQTVGFRAPGNITPNQVVELLAQSLALPLFNLEQNGVAAGSATVPENLRALTSGVYGIGSATYGNIDLSNLGDGTFRIGSNISGSGNGTATGTIAAGAGDLFRVGGGGTATFSGTNAFTGTAGLEVGAGLRLNATPSNSAGTVVLTGSNDYSGGTTVNRGSTLNFQAANALGTGPVQVFGTINANQAGGSFTSGAGLVNDQAVSLYGGGTLVLDNGALTTDGINRWGDDTNLSLTNNTVTFNSANNLLTTTENIGALQVTGGNVINLNRGNASGATTVMRVEVDAITRSNNGTAEFVRSTGTGAGWGGGQILNVTGTAPTVTNGMVAPWIVMQNNSPAQFATYNGTSLVPVTYDTTINTAAFTAGIPAVNKVTVTTADPTLGDDPSIYALRSERTINTNGAFDTITLGSGGLILSNIADNTTLNINPAIVSNDGTANQELLVYTAGGGTGRNYAIPGAITATGLTKFGTGNLILATNNAAGLSGPVSINAGTLQLVGPAAGGDHSPAGTGQILLNGGQLNLRSNATTAVAYTLQNTGVTLGQGIPTATIDVNRGDAASANLTLTINPAAAGGAGLVLAGSAGAQGQTLNLIGGNGYALTFGSKARISP
jgi:fibronectin-binding autotransporter adhesin